MSIEISRKEVREHLAGLLSAAMVPNIVAEVYPYQVADLGGQTPVICISSGGSDRVKPANSQVGFILRLQTFVLYGNKGTWTEELAEDRLDLIEKTVDQTLAANLRTDYWQYIAYNGESVPDYVVMDDGLEYRRESTPLRVEVF